MPRGGGGNKGERAGQVARTTSAIHHMAVRVTVTGIEVFAETTPRSPPWLEDLLYDLAWESWQQARAPKMITRVRHTNRNIDPKTMPTTAPLDRPSDA